MDRPRRRHRDRHVHHSRHRRISRSVVRPLPLVWWRHDVLGEGYVPDSELLTLTFFGALLTAMALIRHTYRPVAPR